MITNAKQLGIDEERLYTVEDIVDVINLIEPTTYSNVFYYIKKGYIENHMGKKGGMGQLRHLIKGKDLFDFLVRKYF